METLFSDDDLYTPLDIEDYFENSLPIAFPTHPQTKYFTLDSCEDDCFSSASTACSPILLQHNKRRMKKTDDQVQQLIEEFHTNPRWERNQVSELARRTGLTEAQVYKWGWDYRKKLKENFIDNSFDCKEMLLPSSLDAELFMIAKSYKMAMGHVNLKALLS